MAKSIIIIGAGIGGLTAAIRLAHLGYDVTLLEKNSQVGGKVCEIKVGGFRWDIAPAPFAPKQALTALFRQLELDMANYLRLQPIDPQTRYFFPDGESFSAHRDWAAFAEEIRRIAPDDYAGVLDFLAYAARLESPIAAAAFKRLPFAPRRSMRRTIARHIKSEKLRRILGSFAASVGGSPYALPAAYCWLAHSAISSGSWYPQDGMASIAAALNRLAHEQGVAIRLNSRAREIRVKGNAARGVALADGQVLEADAVLSNVDVFTTLRYLMPAAALPAPAQRHLNRTKLSCSAFVIMLGVRGSFPQLAHHNIFYSREPEREYYDLFQREIMPEDPTISLTISSKTDPLNAPINQENWLIAVQAPPLSEKLDWAAQREDYRDRVLATLYERYGLDLRDRVRIEQHLTPADFQAMTGAWRGALFGQSAHGTPAPIGIAGDRSALVAKLYFAGGTTQPGGDNALGIRSGWRAAEAVAQDLS
ncbi:MAG: phytoene desaturase family protein [Chloroflexi bacterium]|nr:phytoene desaturase family protein [Chloroflexota bacterium]